MLTIVLSFNKKILLVILIHQGVWHALPEAVYVRHLRKSTNSSGSLLEAHTGSIPLKVFENALRYENKKSHPFLGTKKKGTIVPIPKSFFFIMLYDCLSGRIKPCFTPMAMLPHEPKVREPPYYALCLDQPTVHVMKA